MKAEQVRPFWAFDPPITDRSEIHCVSCGEWSPLSEWEMSYIDCETCGDHDAMECPKCGELYDHVHSDLHPLKTRKPECD